LFSGRPALWQFVFDFRAHFCHSVPIETHAFGFRLRPTPWEEPRDFLSVLSEGEVCEI
jgi:hypothetical protein